MWRTHRDADDGAGTLFNKRKNKYRKTLLSGSTRANCATIIVLLLLVDIIVLFIYTGAHHIATTDHTHVRK